MDRRLKIGVILLAIGLILFGLVVLTAAVGQSPYVAVIFAVPGLIFTLLGVGQTISAISPTKRGVLSILIGAFFCVLSTYIIFALVVWSDIALIMSLIVSLMWSMVLIVPGAIVLAYKKLATPISVVCVWIAMSLFWTSVGELWVASTATDFRTAFYISLPFLLFLGFFLGLISTGFLYMYYDTRMRH